MTAHSRGCSRFAALMVCPCCASWSLGSFIGSTPTPPASITEPSRFTARHFTQFFSPYLRSQVRGVSRARSTDEPPSLLWLHVRSRCAMAGVPFSPLDGLLPPVSADSSASEPLDGKRPCGVAGAPSIVGSGSTKRKLEAWKQQTASGGSTVPPSTGGSSAGRWLWM